MTKEMRQTEPVCHCCGMLNTNTWFVPLSDTHLMVVDPAADDQALVNLINEYAPDHISIVLTHGHFDHLAGVPLVIKHFPFAKVHIHQGDSWALGANAAKHHRDLFRPMRLSFLVDSLTEALPEASSFLCEGDCFEQWKVIHTPGHSCGSICLYHEERQWLLSGDTLFYHGLGRTDLHGASENAIYASLKKLLALPQTVRVFPGHGRTTSIGAEKKFFKVS